MDDAGEVVKNTWQDCQDGCPGTSRMTYIDYLSSKDLLQMLCVMKEFCLMLRENV